MSTANDKVTTAQRWQEEAKRSIGDLSLRLRLAAMAGHMLSDLPAARRGTIIDILADGRPHPREELIRRLEADLGVDCWGLRPHEALLRDIATLRRGGIRVAYSRRNELEGYYLEYPPLVIEPRQAFTRPDDEGWLMRIRLMSVATKNETAFASADFAMQQKRALLWRDHPEWSDPQIDGEARRLVFGGR